MQRNAMLSPTNHARKTIIPNAKLIHQTTVLMYNSTTMKTFLYAPSSTMKDAEAQRTATNSQSWETIPLPSS